MSTPAITERIVNQLGARQHGVVSRAQLVAAGVLPHVIDYRIRTRRLEPVRRGIYRVGPVRGAHEAEFAALLATGHGALLSHASSAALQELMTCGDPAVHVTIEGGNRAPGRGIVVHRVRTLPADEISSAKGLPVTSVARTLLDLAGHMTARELEQALATALRHDLVKHGELERTLARHVRRPGASVLRGLLRGKDQIALTRSEAENRFLALVRQAQMRAPEANVRINGHEVDFLWRAERLVVEIDGFAYHSSTAAFERDRARDGALIAAGMRVMRVTWRQLQDSPLATLVRVGQALVRTP